MKIDIFSEDRHFDTRRSKGYLLNFIKKVIDDLSNGVTEKTYTENGEKINLFPIGGGFAGFVYGIESRHDIFGIKVQPCGHDYKAEIEAFKEVSKLTSPNLPLLYGTTNYNNNCYIFMELAHGSMKRLLQFRVKETNLCKDHKKLYKSISQQIIFGLYAFHKTGYAHDDPNEENFLFRFVNENVNKIPLYIDDIQDHEFEILNCGFVLKLYDYGTAKKIKSGRDIINDYRGAFERASNVVPYELFYELADKSKEMLKNKRFSTKRKSVLGKSKPLLKSKIDKLSGEIAIKLLEYLKSK